MTTLEKLAKYYNTTVRVNEQSNRKFVELQTQKHTYFVIDNDMTDENTLLVATERHNDFQKITNNRHTIDKLINMFDSHFKVVEQSRSAPTKKAVELFGELYAY
ncbi:hypothetical protein BCT19_01275 [Vibrio splendidus]|uniref:hypothetical protein n=1 Tax=Vibrio splendidus TaxID=29497 RepID=UPI000C822B4D|nr:hypothetical protein [Vibrio splendidus]PMO04343.1 hypothetical protein BCT19_01275 [Vibrio splendidus]